MISSTLSSPSESITITPSSLYFKKASHNPTHIALWCPILKLNLKTLRLIFLPNSESKGYDLIVEQSSTAITFIFKSNFEEKDPKSFINLLKDSQSLKTGVTIPRSFLFIITYN